MKKGLPGTVGSRTIYMGTKTAADSNSDVMPGWEEVLESGTPCDHPGCKQHVSHPCETCGRKAAFGRAVIRETTYLKS